MQFPIKLNVIAVVAHSDMLVEVRYDVVDAEGYMIQQSHVYCKPADVDEVCGYTLERLSLALAQPAKSNANVYLSESVRAAIAAVRGTDQNISAPGVLVPSGAGR